MTTKKKKRKSFRVPVGPLAEGQRFGRTSDDSYQFENGYSELPRGPVFDDRESVKTRTSVDRWLFSVAWATEILNPTADPMEVINV